MNQRVVLFVLLGSFVTCFVGTCAVGTLTVIDSVASGVTLDAPTRVDDTPPIDPLPPEDSAPPESTDDTSAPPDDTSPPGEDDEPYAAPLIGFGSFAVYHPVKPKLDPWATLQKAAKGTHVQVYREEAPASALPPFMEFQTYDTEEFGVVTGVPLDSGYGLSAQVKAALPDSKQVSVLVVTMPVGTASGLEVARVVAAFAQATGGVLWDEQTQEYFSLDAWRTRRIASWDKGVPQASLNLNVFAEGSGDTLKLETSGLQHFGVPELRLAAVPEELEDEGVVLLHAVAQRLLEEKDSVNPGFLTISLPELKNVGERKRLLSYAQRDAAKESEVMLTSVPGAQVVTLGVALPRAGSPGERMEAALTELFGTTVLPPQ